MSVCSGRKEAPVNFQNHSICAYIAMKTFFFSFWRGGHWRAKPTQVLYLKNHCCIKTAVCCNKTSPLLAKSLAVSLPMPVLAPVIMTVLPSNRSSDVQRLQHTFLGTTQKKALIQEKNKLLLFPFHNNGKKYRLY